MPQFQPTIKLPFDLVQGIPPHAASQIRRDFQEVIANFPAASPSEFDAIIDSSLSSSSPSTHKYKNLTDLIAGESWTTTLSVGVVQRAGSHIVEPAAMSLVGKGDLTLTGIGDATPDATHVGWDWQVLSLAANQQFFAYNIAFAPTTVITVLVAGFSFFTGCSITGGNVTVGWSNSEATCFDCTWDNGNNGVTMASVKLHYYSGSLTNIPFAIGNGGVLNIYGGGSTGGVSFTTTVNAQLTAYATLLGTQLNIGGTSNVLVSNLGAIGSTVTVSSTGHVEIYGSWAGITMSGASTTTRIFSGSGNSMDFTGPGRCDYTNASTAGGNRLTLRGDHIVGEVSMPIYSPAAIKFISCTHSAIFATVGDIGAGSQAYTFDAASSHNLLVLGGSNSAGFTTPSTDAGTFNRVITEISDTVPGVIIAAATYAPAALANYVLSNTAMTALDVTNMTVGPFTVPANGKILVTVQAEIQLTTPAGSGGEVAVALLNHTGGAQLGFNIHPVAWGVAAVSSPVESVAFEFYVTGLTAGSSLQLDVAGCVGPNLAGVSGNIYAQGYTGLVNGAKASPATMIVRTTL